ncbi:hypothetical protein [Paenibacillus hamazuiensis]|uniref:hypothetical protein n=1 Tax=Paenibacillus hamazuiensis TaxID=2936508 RepID=UPI00200D93E0|nr:hypothetical protein [Paenibacillus hamazuiensis]
MLALSSKNVWKKQLVKLLVCFLVVGGFPVPFAEQEAKAAPSAPAPGGVSTDLISWFELTRGWKEGGANDTQYITKVQDLADSARAWTIYKYSSFKRTTTFQLRKKINQLSLCDGPQ